MVWEVIFWISVIGIIHSYLFFPLILNIKAKGKKQNNDVYSKDAKELLPKVSILLAAYNEEAVIEEKIKSTFNTSYPIENIEFLIGSDASTDATNSIIEKYTQKFPGLKLVNFGGRTGKAGIINQLSDMATNDHFILTDANVFFDRDTIYHLVKHYKNPEIGLVGGRIINIDLKKDGISLQEKSYLDRENMIKYQEGIVWGTMIGAFGGCYSIRKASYSKVPARFFMDDFYITMRVLEQGKRTINELDAICFEDVSNKISEEFRRKIRISIGNFQNLVRFKKLLLDSNSGLAFSFWSHKVLRWLGPFFLICALISNLILLDLNFFYRITFILQLILISIPVLDISLKQMKIHLKILRFTSHFYLMNLALLIGFFKFLNGVESNIWQPTQRYQ